MSRGSSQILAAFSKVQPYLIELQKASGEPEFCKHIEAVVMKASHAEVILKRRREALRAAAKKNFPGVPGKKTKNLLIIPAFHGCLDLDNSKICTLSVFNAFDFALSFPLP